MRKLNIRPRGDGDNEISLLFPNHFRIVGLPGSEATIRGFTASLILTDEAARVSEDIYTAARPMRATQDGELWLISTPNGRRGFFHEEWMGMAADRHADSPARQGGDFAARRADL